MIVVVASIIASLAGNRCNLIEPILTISNEIIDNNVILSFVKTTKYNIKLIIINANGNIEVMINIFFFIIKHLFHH
jgi:hypothetical protein